MGILPVVSELKCAYDAYTSTLDESNVPELSGEEGERATSVTHLTIQPH